MIRQNRLRGVEPGYLTSAARYKREDDIPLAVFGRVLQALEEVALEEVALEELPPARLDPGTDGPQADSGE